MKLKSEMGVAKQLFVSRFRKMHGVSCIKNQKPAHRSRRRQCRVGDFPTSDFDHFAKRLKSCKLKLLGFFICDKIRLSIILFSVLV